MKKSARTVLDICKLIVGCALFGLGFSLFLTPSGLNAGGISGLSMVLVELMNQFLTSSGLNADGISGFSSVLVTLIGYCSVGTVTAIINLPLFLLGGFKVGKKFFVGSLIGMALSSAAIDLFALITPPANLDPLMGAIYGGVTCGVGLGLVFSTGASTGGSDIIVRLLKRRWAHVPIGTINICFDLGVALLTGIAFRDITRTLYSGIAIFLCGQVIDAVVYRFDYSKVAIIITKEHEKVAEAISTELDRGATYLTGEGTYSHQELKVILTAVKRHQIATLKSLVVEIDPDAFVIVQEAHQVLGDGFSRYTKDSL